VSVRPGGKLRWLVVFSAVLVVPTCLTAAADVPSAAAATAMKVSKSPRDPRHPRRRDQPLRRKRQSSAADQAPSRRGGRHLVQQPAVERARRHHRPVQRPVGHRRSRREPVQGRAAGTQGQRGMPSGVAHLRASREARDHQRRDRVQAGRLLQADRAWDDEEDRVHTEPERLPACGPAVPRYVHLRGPGLPGQGGDQGFPRRG
jgi:hypothetical protein